MITKKTIKGTTHLRRLCYYKSSSLTGTVKNVRAKENPKQNAIWISNYSHNSMNSQKVNQLKSVNL